MPDGVGCLCMRGLNPAGCTDMLSSTPATTHVHMCSAGVVAAQAKCGRQGQDMCGKRLVRALRAVLRVLGRAECQHKHCSRAACME